MLPLHVLSGSSHHSGNLLEQTQNPTHTLGFLCAAARLCSSAATNWGPTASDMAVSASHTCTLRAAERVRGGTGGREGAGMAG